MLFIFLLIPPPPRSILFPYTTLFRSSISFPGDKEWIMASENCPKDDGVDRRGFLECMAWAGTGLLWTVNGGQRHRRSEEHTSELQSRRDLVCRLLLEKKKKNIYKDDR